ncbi:sensor histidine kinase [Massilia endophytica]|uniref:sensor histidine kinase n=1 Tax=Massilia endophytica TaxID=2899220 RepID=UPI001E308BEF|nr:sensor histidine kinase [Massilia endophytica]UGQ45200.1 histidine kinase [Massilia endophytica]
MSQAPSCLDAIWQSTRSELFLFDPDSLRCVAANPAALRQTGYAEEALASLQLPVLAPLAPPLDGPDRAATLRRADGSSYPATLRLLSTHGEGRTLLLLMAEDAALQQVQARFDAIVSHTPGLVYQFRQHADGRVAFPYLSEGCQALLGLPAAQLHAEPERFLQLVLAEDRPSYLESMRASAASLWSWNWEGRIWIDAWKDVKWINLRSTPHRLADGAVQWEGIMTNITESKLEQMEVRASRARLAELTAHSEKVKEQERTRIAREIHDDLGGNLTAIKMALAMLAARLPEEPALHQKAAYVDELVDRTIDAAHRITLDLRPSILDFGLVAALEWQVKEFASQAGLACSFQSSEPEVALDADSATALFRIVQEALTNIAKHAQASRVSVRLAPTRQHIALKITDNGKGIGPADRGKPASFGLRGMAERARALNGTLTLSHAPGGGTVVAIKIPRPRDTISGQEVAVTR